MQASTTEQEVQFEDERARLLLRDGLDVLRVRLCLSCSYAPS